MTVKFAGRTLLKSIDIRKSQLRYSQKMEEMQYLIRCTDTSLCVIFERSILMNKNVVKLNEGDNVHFLWPEDSPKARSFSGKIIMISRKFILFLKLLNTIEIRNTLNKEILFIQYILTLF